MRVHTRRALPALVVVGALALVGCSSEEPVVQGADGSGVFDRETSVNATLRAVDPADGPGGPAVGSARARAADGGVRLEVRLRDAEPGSWAVRVSPGSTCADGTDGDAVSDVPDLTVEDDGRGLLDTTLDVPLADLADGAALLLAGPTGPVCGVLADY